MRGKNEMLKRGGQGGEIVSQVYYRNKKERMVEAPHYLLTLTAQEYSGGWRGPEREKESGTFADVSRSRTTIHLSS